jgi:hypothetical protein
MKMDFRNKTYGRKLINAAITGISKREARAGNEPPVEVILKCLTVSALGTCAQTHVLKGRVRFSRTVLCAAAGFFAALAWNTRKVTGAMARSAAEEVGKVRDEHWLEMNPINYA